MLELRSILRLSKTALVSFLENHVKRVESTIKISNGSTQGHVKLEWRRRWITVEGQATPAGFTIAFEGREGISVRDRFNLQLTRPDNRSYAKISVNGTDDSFKFSAPSLPKIAKAVLISVPRLMAVLVRSSSDILTFIRTKDAATSERLRRRFGVTSVTDPGRSVPPGFFSHHSTRITQNIEATIILPIYNAAEDLGQLLPHLHRNPYPIILVNDGSEDPRIPQLISNFVLKNENAKLIENSQNQGFVSSINKGIAESSGHIIILNSDALPPPMDWATRLLEPIIRDSKIATVTPFSNNAEIISIPSKSDASQITYNAVREIDNFASHISDRHSEIELPTGIGFCMAMNQDYVDRIGGFDPAFGRGYGEEVDWCQKAKRLGGRSIGLASLFVGHKGGSSFGAQKTARIRDASQIISKRYPDYDATVQNWVESAPARIQTLALSIAWLANASSDPVSIFIGHSMGGGAENALQEEIASTLKDQPGVILLRVGGPSLWRIEIKGHDFSYVGDAPDIQTVLEFLDPLKDRKLIYSCGAGGRHPMDAAELLLELADRQNTLDVRMHDFFPISPSWNLLNEHGEFEGIPALSTTDRAHCLPPLARRPAVLHVAWRDTWARVLSNAREITVFSKASAALVRKAYPDVAQKIVVRPHSLKKLPRQIRKGGASVGVLGSLNQAKGAEVVQRLSTCDAFSRKLVVLGELDKSFRLRRPHIFHGRYEHERISELAEKYDVGIWLIPSICPETFSFATHEALATGLPVLAFARGAQGEAVASAGNGHPIATDPADVNAIVQSIERAFAN